MNFCLIVDDSPVIRKIIRQILEELKFTCAEAENGSIAYDFCDKVMPDLIMLDWNMPVLNGIDFLKKLRHTENGKKPMVIFCTTENDMSRIQTAIEEGANDFIMKPFDKEILRSKLVQNGILQDTAF
jgi:two-component system chemotaxis response regulator CheY